MGRIRTIKPELFRHEALFDAEVETGLPLRLAFIGLFTVCDREGRFKWRPRAIKAEVMPYDDGVDFSRVLDACVTRGFVVKYASQGVEYGCITSFTRHQVINARESVSELPDPNDPTSETLVVAEDSTRAPRVDDASTTRHVHAHGEGKGREGKGKEGKEVAQRDASPTVAADLLPVAAAPGPAVWSAYAAAYAERHGVEPVRNAKVNAQLAQLVKRLGADAADVAAHYVRSPSAYYAQRGHSVDCLLADAEKLRTEWATGRSVTAIGARQGERLSHHAQLAATLKQELIANVR